MRHSSQREMMHWQMSRSSLALADALIELFLWRPPGLQRRPARAHLVIVLVIRHMRRPFLRRCGAVDYRNA
jgi:hypothetical protein